MVAQPQEQQDTPIAIMAQALYEAGILTFPGSAKAKHPDRVKHWSAEHYPPNGWPIPQQHAVMFMQPDVSRMFVVCGARSGNVACLDFDQPEYFEPWAAQVPPALYDRLYIEQSQRTGGGFHVVVRTTEPVGTSSVPARNPRSDDGTDGAIRIEVRGEGQGFMAAPSVGYEWIQGDLANLPVLTNDEYHLLIDAAVTFTECEPRPVVERTPVAPRPADADERPGDRFNRENGQAEVLDMFVRHAWTTGKRGGETVDITHPTATSETSGNVNRDGVTHIFSTNTAFETSASGQGKGHSPFAVYATLEHGGDFAKAGRALHAMYNPTPIYKTRPVRQGAGPTLHVVSSDQEAGEPTQDAPSRPLTDLGNAERLIDRYGDALRYSVALGWLAWNDKNWESDEIGQVHTFAKATARDMLREASDIDGNDSRKALVKHAMRSESAASLANMVQLARTEPGVPVRTAELDTDPWLLTVANGTLNLRTGELRAHRREDLITKSSPVIYDPNTTCPLWMAFLRRIMDGDQGLVSYIQRITGYSLTGDTSERAMFVLHGNGKNGKSTLLAVLSELIGDFAQRSPTEMLMQRRNEGIPNDVAKLRGARFVFASEAEEGQRLAESRIKDLTGGDRIAARFMRGEWFEFEATFKIWFSTNHRPVIRGTDDAIWDRVKLIPFNVRFPDTEQRPRHTVMAEFRAELPGILAWAVRGCLDWRREGLGTPAAVKNATDDYRSDMDTLGAWIADECIVSPRESCGAKELYEDYKRWADNSGERPVTEKAFAAQMQERGFVKKRVTKGQSYNGIRPKLGSEMDEAR